MFFFYNSNKNTSIHSSSAIIYFIMFDFILVLGKCIICAFLTLLRKMYRSQVAREFIRVLHAFHRMTYMSQRREYAWRINEAYLFPSANYQLTQDGMSQNHTKLPFAGQNDSATKKRLDFKIQGMLAHMVKSLWFIWYITVFQQGQIWQYIVSFVCSRENIKEIIINCKTPFIIR